jgi:hypothetical protein
MSPLRPLALALLLSAAPIALAQPAAFEPIAPGQTVTGALRAEDPGFSQRGPFHVYRLEAREGTRYVADLRSSTFDAYLVLMREVGGLTEPVREDDDSGQGTDARLRFRAEGAGPYLLVAQALSEGASGPFTLSLQELPPPPPLAARPVSLGDRVEAELTDADPVFDLGHGGEALQHLYRLEGRAGQGLLITMDSDDFDSYLEFGPLRGDDIEATDSDDDGGDGRNARLRLTLPADGTYGIRARTYGEGPAGRYTLRVDEWTPRAATPRPLTLGQDVEGELTEDDAELADGSFHHAWTFLGQEGQRIRIRMRSDDFDTFLTVGQRSGEAFTAWATNDDAEDDGTNSMVEVVLPASGEVTVQASTFSAGATGHYTLHAERL